MVKKERVRDTSDPSQIRSEEDMRAYRALEEKKLLLEVLGTYAGRRVIFCILARADMQGDCNSTEVAILSRFLGRRSIGLEILHDVLTASPDLYILMQEESGRFEKQFAFNNIEEGWEDG